MAMVGRLPAPVAIRKAALHRLVEGETAGEIAESLGVSPVSVARWGKLVGMKLLRGQHGGVIPVPLTAPEGSAGRAYRRLTLADRMLIELGLANGWSARRIAAHVGVAPSTITREVSRNATPTSPGRRTPSDATYWGEIAQYRAAQTRHADRPKKLDDLLLRVLVRTGLNDRYSPQQVAGRLRLLFPTSPELHVSHETIYQALYVQGKGALRHELKVEKALRSGRTGRVPQSKLPPRSNRPWLAGARLSDRPAQVEDRAVPGNWEGDLVVGPNNSGIVTLVERSTRYALLGRLPGRRDSATVIEVLQGMIHSLPKQLLHTITWDQGSEMAEHARFTVESGCRVFFCDPHSPWQRGTNENTNGLIRDFYPKGTDFNLVSDEDLANTQRLLNIRPRQTLGFETPGERLGALIDGVALEH